jgi:hypothetical protein
MTLFTSTIVSRVVSGRSQDVLQIRLPRPPRERLGRLVARFPADLYDFYRGQKQYVWVLAAFEVQDRRKRGRYRAGLTR